MVLRGKKENHILLREEVLEHKIEGKLMQSWDDDTYCENPYFLECNFPCLRGKIGNSLAGLQHLKHLNLSGNYFEGSLSTQLENLSNLRSLDLSRKFFDGIPPTQLGNLSNLQSINLSGSCFEGMDTPSYPMSWKLLELKMMLLSNMTIQKMKLWPLAVKNGWEMHPPAIEIYHRKINNDLADLVEMIYTVVQLMENLQAHGTLRVSRKSRKGRKKKTSSDKKASYRLMSLKYLCLGQEALKAVCHIWMSKRPNILPMIFTMELMILQVMSKHMRLVKLMLRTNHYIICILRKICDDLELSPMLYQLSLLTIFHNILDKQKSCPCKDYENIVCFLKNFVRKMLRKTKSQPLLFVEIRFWKSLRECHYFASQSLLQELGSLKTKSGKWGNISRHGEIGSTQAKGWMHRSLADALGEDEADVVISHKSVYEKNDDNFSEVEEGITPIPSGEIDGKRNSDKAGHHLEQEFESVFKRKRRLVLSAEVDQKIKDLYEKFKDDRHCSCLIAEALDPDCKVSPVQVSNKLKQLGLKIAPKKRMLQVDVPLSDGTNQLMEEARAVGEESAPLVSSNNPEGSLVRKSLHTRKRVRAFSKDQEETIRALFEQFKGHKRCAHMIASSLASDDALTAAQVSRKLKQLGLHVHRQKITEGNMHLRDEDVNDSDMAKVQDSDDETLLSLMKRGKKDNHGLLCEEVLEQKIEGKLMQNSDDETLSSVLKKARRPLNLDEKHTNTSNEGLRIDYPYDHIVVEDITKKDGCTLSNELEVAGIEDDVAFKNVSSDDNSEDEIMTFRSEKQLEDAPTNNGDISPNHQQVIDELADLGDDDNF